MGWTINGDLEALRHTIERHGLLDPRKGCGEDNEYVFLSKDPQAKTMMAPKSAS